MGITYFTCPLLLSPTTITACYSTLMFFADCQKLTAALTSCLFAALRICHWAAMHSCTTMHHCPRPDSSCCNRPGTQQGDLTCTSLSCEAWLHKSSIFDPRHPGSCWPPAILSLSLFNSMKQVQVHLQECCSPVTAGLAAQHCWQQHQQGFRLWGEWQLTVGC